MTLEQNFQSFLLVYKRCVNSRRRSEKFRGTGRLGQTGRKTELFIFVAAMVGVAVLVGSTRNSLQMDKDGRADVQNEASELPVAGKSASEPASGEGLSDAGRPDGLPNSRAITDFAATSDQVSSVTTDQIGASNQSSAGSITSDGGPGDSVHETEAVSGELDLTGPGGGADDVDVPGPGPGDSYDPEGEFGLGPGSADIPTGEKGPGDGASDLGGLGPGET